jgi:3-oxosteroid 1-dehydrogenase
MISTLESRDIVGTTLKNRLSVMKMMAAYLLNPFRSLAKIDTRLTIGNALIGRLRLSLSERNVPLHLNTKAKELVYENGKVTGLIAEKDGKSIHIKANKGVILAAGGFEKNQAMREKYQEAPVSSDWTLGHWENQGDAINMGLAIGASVSLMEDAWWMPVAMVPGKYMPWYIKGAWWEDAARNKGVDMPWLILGERCLPGCIFVNSKGRRFTNEAVPYVDFVKNQLKSHHNGEGTVPAFMIADNRFHFKYAYGPVMPAFSAKKYIDCGHIISAETVGELADKCGIDREGLIDEVEKNNRFATQGVDSDFHKGDTSIDRYYADDAVKPNPCLAVIDKPPYYAIKSYPGDLGTKGGLDTDEHARVLKTDGTPIEGLYATGNCASDVMVNTYAGAGGTIGPAMVFGYIAANHASH